MSFNQSCPSRPPSHRSFRDPAIQAGLTHLGTPHHHHRWRDWKKLLGLRNHKNSAQDHIVPCDSDVPVPSPTQGWLQIIDREEARQALADLRACLCATENLALDGVTVVEYSPKKNLSVWLAQPKHAGSVPASQISRDRYHLRSPDLERVLLNEGSLGSLNPSLLTLQPLLQKIHRKALTACHYRGLLGWPGAIARAITHGNFSSLWRIARKYLRLLHATVDDVVVSMILLTSSAHANDPLLLSTTLTIIPFYVGESFDILQAIALHLTAAS